MKIRLISFLVLFSLASCGIDEEVVEKTTVSTVINNSDTLSIDLLLFRAENIIDIWQYTPKGNMMQLNTFHLESKLNWPIGRFEWKIESETGLKVKFPSSFYREKQNVKAIPTQHRYDDKNFTLPLPKKDLEFLLSNLTDKKTGKLLILPSKPLKNGHFKPMLNVPHWTSELYAMLELELKNYPINGN